MDFGDLAWATEVNTENIIKKLDADGSIKSSAFFFFFFFSCFSRLLNVIPYFPSFPSHPNKTHISDDEFERCLTPCPCNVFYIFFFVFFIRLRICGRTKSAIGIIVILTIYFVLDIDDRDKEKI